MTNIRTADEALTEIMSHMSKASREDMRSMSVPLPQHKTSVQEMMESRMDEMSTMSRSELMSHRGGV